MKWLLFLLALPLGATSFYRDHNAWYAATHQASAVFEDFQSQTLIPGLDIESIGTGGFGVAPGPGYGHVDPIQQAWVDCTGKDCPSIGLGTEPYTFTSITYNRPLWGLGAFWRIDSGYGIDITSSGGNFQILYSIDPNAIMAPVPGTAQPEGFVGFTSDQPFSNLVISWWGPTPSVGTNAAFEIRGLELLTSNPVPEPATWVLLLLGFGLVGIRRIMA